MKKRGRRRGFWARMAVLSGIWLFGVKVAVLGHLRLKDAKSVVLEDIGGKRRFLAKKSGFPEKS